jgi:cell wall-associated NlpC family hydrolase
MFVDHQAIKWLGVPFKEGGKAKDGADCGGLVQLWYLHELGIDISDHGFDRSAPHSVLFDGQSPLVSVLEDDFEPLRKIPDARPMRHDILLFRHRRKEPDHVGIVLSPTRFLHVLEGGFSCAAEIASWRSRLVEIYRHKSLLKKD